MLTHKNFIQPLKVKTLLSTLMIFFPSIVLAANISVTPGMVDNNSNNGNCSIVDAIKSANLDASIDSCTAGSGSDTIKLDGATYSMLSIVDHSFGNNALPCITSHIILDGEGGTITRGTAANLRLLCVSSTGYLVLKNTTISNGRADGPGLTYQLGGGIYARGKVDIMRSNLNGNTAQQQGGALYVLGAATAISNSSFNNNTALKGGAIRIDGGAALNIADTVFSSNHADFGGAAFFNDSIAHITNTQVHGNSSNQMGGGLYYSGATGSVTSSVISNNTTVQKGGGVRVDNFSTVSILKTSIHNNVSSDYGGGGVYVIKSSMDIRQSTFSNNHSGRGGGLYVDVSHTTVENSTFSGNSVTNFGGAIYVDADESLALYNASITLKSDTIAGNSAQGGAGLWLNPITKATIGNTIISLNDTVDCTVSSSASLISLGGNWFGDNNCQSAGRGNPKIGPLADNGGSTKSRALLNTSLAIDSANTPACPSIDQRDRTRPAGPDCDIGAFEFSSDTETRSTMNGALYLLL